MISEKLQLQKDFDVIDNEIKKYSYCYKKFDFVNFDCEVFINPNENDFRLKFINYNYGLVTEYVFTFNNLNELKKGLREEFDIYTNQGVDSK